MKDFCRLRHFPISFFSMIMWLGGMTIVSQKIEYLLDWHSGLSYLFLSVTVFAFFVLIVMYIAKLIRFPQEVKKEFFHPIKINFFPTFPISFLVLSIAFIDVFPIVASYLWIVGATLNLIFILSIFKTYIGSDRFAVNHISPAWFIPVVSSILVPITGMEVALDYPQISWFFFAVWFMLWVGFMFIVFYRMIFHTPLPQKLVPTMAILVAPPSIAFIAYMHLNGCMDNFANFLYYFAVFMFLFVLLYVPQFFKLKYYLSWWAYSFPLAAFTLATTLMYHHTHLLVFKIGAVVLSIMLLLIIVFLFIKTLYHVQHKTICVEEE